MTKHSLPNPENVTRVVLPNGLRILVRENHAAPVAVLDGYLPVGAIHEPGEQAGLSSFVASLLTRGSAHYDFDSFNETIEAIGASLGVGSDRHTASLGSTSLSEDFPTMVAVLADILRRPTFPAEHIERVRQQKLVSLQEREQDTQRMAALRFQETLYAGHPYGRSISGYTPTVSTIQRDDLVNFHARHYTPNGGVLVVVGDVETAQVLDLLQQHFADWHGPVADQRIPTLPKPAQVTRLHHAIAGKVQADIVLGCPAIPRHHPDYYALRVANCILGQFGMMGRLGEQVREEQGLAYYSYSSFDADEHAGLWIAEAGVSPENVEQAVASMLAEFARLGSEPVGEEELSDSQAYMTGTMPLRLETNDGVASTLLSMEWHGLGLDYLQRYNELINNITPADVQRVAQKYWPADGYTLVVAGPE
jgi:zinc protease